MGSLYGFEVESELPLRRLNRARGERGRLHVVAAGKGLPETSDPPVSVLENEHGRWYASYELGERCLLELPPSGRFLLDPGAGLISVAEADGDGDLFEHRLASSAICTLLAMRGDLVLHAAALEHGGRAVVFCGPTGRGKSTLARVAGEAGSPVLGEDGIALALDGEAAPVAFPGARGVRIRGRDDADRPRTGLVDDPGPREPGPCPVASVILLGERAESLSIEPLEPARALALLTPNLVHSGGRSAIGAAFARLARLLHTVPAFAAVLPDDLEALPTAGGELLDTVVGRG